MSRELEDTDSSCATKETLHYKDLSWYSLLESEASNWQHRRPLKIQIKAFITTKFIITLPTLASEIITFTNNLFHIFSGHHNFQK